MTSPQTALLDEVAAHAPRSTVEAAARVLRAAADPATKPAQTAFLARALGALARLATTLDERDLGDAAGAPSDYAVLLWALEHPAAQALLAQDDPLAPARLRGLRLRQEWLQAEGGTLGVEEVGALLGISRQAVDKRRRTGTLLAIDTGRHGYRYPAWQFRETGGTLIGLEQVLAALRAHDPWMQIAFFLTPNTRLQGETPLHALRSGQLEAVLCAATMYGEHGAA